MPRKKKRSRRRKTFSILNALEAYIYASILSMGTVGSGPISFLTGDTDLQMKSTMTSVGIGSRPEQTLSTQLVGASEISLGDLISQPGLAVPQMADNFQANLVPMAIAAFGTSVTFRIGKRLLRKPISSINRNIVKPALGAGVRL